MAIAIARSDDGRTLFRPGKRSLQIVEPARFPAATVTITRAVLDPGAVSPRHAHRAAGQIWLIERGEGRLLEGNGGGRPLTAGDVVVTPPGEVHGIENSGTEPFVYLTVTNPPEDMGGHYDADDKDEA